MLQSYFGQQSVTEIKLKVTLTILATQAHWKNTLLQKLEETLCKA